MNRTEIDDYRDMRVLVVLRHERITGTMICTASAQTPTTSGPDLLIIQLDDGSHVARPITDIESIEGTLIR